MSICRSEEPYPGPFELPRPAARSLFTATDTLAEGYTVSSFSSPRRIAEATFHDSATLLPPARTMTAERGPKDPFLITTWPGKIPSSIRREMDCRQVRSSKDAARRMRLTKKGCPTGATDKRHDEQPGCTSVLQVSGGAGKSSPVLWQGSRPPRPLRENKVQKHPPAEEEAGCRGERQQDRGRALFPP